MEEDMEEDMEGMVDMVGMAGKVDTVYTALQPSYT